MVTSILRETTVSLSDVETELQALASPQKRAARNLVVLLASLLAFVLLAAVSTGPSGIFVVILVLLFHELGHLAAMKMFGYRDVQMFFIPLFGAAVSGVETNPSGTRRAIVSLCGPAPGIALGIVCTILFHSTGREFFMHSARALLILNTFNLIPFVPLDGGRYVEAVLFSRSPMLQTLFNLAGGLVLALTALVSRDIVFGVISIFVLGSVKRTHFSSKLATQIKRELATQDAAESGSADSGMRHRVPVQYIERLIPLLEQRLPEQQCNASAVAAAVHRIWNMVWFRPPSMLGSAGLMLLYLACFGTGILATIGAEVSFRSGRPQLRESGPGAAGNDPDAAWIAERGAQFLSDVLRSVDLPVVREGRRLSVGETQIDVEVHMENRARQDGLEFLAADVRINIDGTLVPAFRAGVIGIDPTVEGARARTVDDWGAQYGAPIGYALARWLGADGAPKVGSGSSNSYLRAEVDGEALYHGRLGTRGVTDVEAIVAEEFVRNLAGRVVPLLGERDRFRSATIKVLRQGATVKDGECRVNGSISPALFAELERVRWPEGQSDALYTMFFAAAPPRRVR